MFSNVLIIDDDLLVISEVKTFISDIGLRVTVAENEAQGLSLIDAMPFDIVIAGLKNGKINGLKILKHSKLRRPKTPVLMLAGNSELKSVVEALRLGADDYIITPCDADDLKYRVLCCLDKIMILRKVREAETDLLRSQIELYSVIRNMPGIVILVGKDSIVSLANHSVSEFSGRSEVAFGGSRIGEVLNCIHSEDDRNGCGFGTACNTCDLRRLVTQTLETGIRHHKEEVVFYVKGMPPRKKNLQVSTAAVEGKVLKVLVCMEDITNMRSVEQNEDKMQNQMHWVRAGCGLKR